MPPGPWHLPNKSLAGFPDGLQISSASQLRFLTFLMAHLLSTLTLEGKNSSDNDESDAATDVEGRGGAPTTLVNATSPILFHKIQNQRSILALLVSDSKLYAGTQNGDLLVWSLKTYELLSTVNAHRGSVLCLCLSTDKTLLFSGAGDAIVNVWCTKTLDRLYSIYSAYDVGDVFSVVYSQDLQTVYLGAQNTSIQWYDLSQKDIRPPPDPKLHPSFRNHRFFDSKGPTGVSTPRPLSASETRSFGGQDLEIDREHIIQYAHYGYVYCMLLARGLDADEPDAETLVSGGGDGVVKLWSLNSDESGALSEEISLENGDGSVLSMALDGTVLYTGRLEGDVNVWDLDTRQLIRTVKAQNADVLALAVGYGLLFSGGSNGIAKIFNSRHENMNRWRAHDHLILASAVASFKSNEIYVTGGNDGCIAIWDISECVNRPARGSRISDEQLVLSLEKLVSYRTVSSKPEYAQDCRRGASYLRNLFKRFGAQTELFNTKDSRNPVVYARFRGKDNGSALGKTILFYGHYDVVAAENREQTWYANPFEMQGVNGYLYGRGVSDNKGPILAALYAAADIAVEQKLSSDILFLVEGEEESGSRGFQEAIKKNKKVIGDVDWILLANSYWLNDDIPCLTYGLRGVIRATIEVASERPDLHSGVDGSQLINEALKDVIALLAKLTDPNGEVNIPGFYDNIPAMTREEDTMYEAISRTLLRNNPDLGDAESLTASFKARWREPSLTIHRVENSGPANSTIISRVAKADLSLRLVPNQTTAAVKKELRSALEVAFDQLNSSNELTIKIEHEAEPWLGDPKNEIFQTLEKAVMEVWGSKGHERRMSTPAKTRASKDLSNGLKSPKLPPATSSTLSSGGGGLTHANMARNKDDTESQRQHPSQKPLYIREGGSIPAIRFLEQEFNAPAAHLPCGQASDSAHLDNERLRLLNLYNSRKIFQKVFQELPFR